VGMESVALIVQWWLLSRDVVGIVGLKVMLLGNDRLVVYIGT